MPDVATKDVPAETEGLARLVTTALAGTTLNFTVGRVPNLGPMWDLSFDNDEVLVRMVVRSGYLVAGVHIGPVPTTVEMLVAAMAAVSKIPQARLSILEPDDQTQPRVITVTADLPIEPGIVPGEQPGIPAVLPGNVLRLLGNVIRATRAARIALGLEVAVPTPDLGPAVAAAAKPRGKKR